MRTSTSLGSENAPRYSLELLFSPPDTTLYPTFQNSRLPPCRGIERGAPYDSVCSDAVFPLFFEYCEARISSPPGPPYISFYELRNPRSTLRFTTRPSSGAVAIGTFRPTYAGLASPRFDEERLKIGEMVSFSGVL